MFVVTHSVVQTFHVVAHYLDLLAELLPVDLDLPQEFLSELLPVGLDLLPELPRVSAADLSILLSTRQLKPTMNTPKVIAAVSSMVSSYLFLQAVA